MRTTLAIPAFHRTIPNRAFERKALFQHGFVQCQTNPLRLLQKVDFPEANRVFKAGLLPAACFPARSSQQWSK